MPRSHLPALTNSVLSNSYLGQDTGIILSSDAQMSSVQFLLLGFRA